MEKFTEFLDAIPNDEHREKLRGVLLWVKDKYPQLETRIGWNMPMFTDHGTFIISFNASRHHLAFSPESTTILKFFDELVAAGFEPMKQQVRIRWADKIDYDILAKIIDFNIADKKDVTTFWR